MLPIEQIRDDILGAVATPGFCVLLTAPTGSGKSTRVPGMLMEAGWGEKGTIIVVQPRRLAARRRRKRRGPLMLLPPPLSPCAPFDRADRRAPALRSHFSASSSPVRRRDALLLHLSPNSRGRSGELSRELAGQPR